MHNSLIINYLPPNLDHAQNPPKTAIIWLHGLGADGHDFAPIVPELLLQQPARFVFPHAPKMAITINGGYVMPAWYDILHMGTLTRDVDVQGVQQSALRVQRIAANLASDGIEQVILVGFSQGGAVAYEAALTYKKPCRNPDNQAQNTPLPKLAGLAALSTYLARPVPPSEITARHSLPILIAHGEQDTMVAPQFSARAAAALVDLGFAPDVHYYAGLAHGINKQEITALGVWLNALI